MVTTATKKILLVITSHAQLGNTGHATGLWLEEFAAPYYAFKDAGFHMTLVSPQGGKPPIDPRSQQVGMQTEATRRFNHDLEAQKAFANTLLLTEVQADDYDALFYPGGHGPLWDLATNPQSIQLIEAFWTQNKPVSAVCHGPIVFMDAKDANGVYLVKDRDVTGFTNSEEAAVGSLNIVPFLLENALIERGGKFSHGDYFTPFAVRDGNLITGQNPASSEKVAQLVIEALK